MNIDEPTPEPLLEFLAARSQWSSSTQERCSDWLRELRQFLARQQVSWERARPQHLKLFEGHLQWTRGVRGLYAPNTIYQALRMVRSFYRWALTSGWVEADPMAGWILPRPPEPVDRILTRLEVLQLFNLPDLATPMGQRDALLLALIYHRGYNLQQCRCLRCNELTWSPDQDASLRAAFERYLQQGRTCQARKNHENLLLTERGTPIQTAECLALRLTKLGKQLGHPKLSVRILHKSWKAHQDSLSRRQSPLD